MHEAASGSDPTIRFGASNLTIHIKEGGCSHPVDVAMGPDGWPVTGWVPLGCLVHNYEHTVGYYCRQCHEQFFYPADAWCD